MRVRVVTGAAAAAPLLLVGALCVQVLVAAPAHAHDTLVSTSPANGATVAKVPGSVKLTFNEAVLGLGTAVVVDGPDGPAQSGKVAVVDETVTQNIASGSPAGAYTVRWRATSADGHPITGTFTFTAGAASASTSTTSATAAPTPTVSASPAAKKKSGEDTNWTAVLIWGAAGAAIGAGYILFRRRRNKA